MTYNCIPDDAASRLSSLTLEILEMHHLITGTRGWSAGTSFTLEIPLTERGQDRQANPGVKREWPFRTTHNGDLFLRGRTSRRRLLLAQLLAMSECLGHCLLIIFCFTIIRRVSKQLRRGIRKGASFATSRTGTGGVCNDVRCEPGRWSIRPGHTVAAKLGSSMSCLWPGRPVWA